MASLAGFSMNTAYSAMLLAGVASHLFIFRVGEWDLQTTKIIAFFASAQAAITAGLLFLSTDKHESILLAFYDASQLLFCFLAGLFGSMLVYRAFFHRLNKFPGPFVARLSNFYPTILSAKRLHLYEEVESLHKQYGDYVRLGPSELSINDPKAIAAIHSTQSSCVKGPWYNVLHPMVPLQMIRTKAEHIPRRRVWDRGFSAKALRDYELRVDRYTDQLLDHLESTQRQPVNVTDWFNFYSFDVMGDLAWGKSFGMLLEGKKHYFLKSLHADATNVGLFSHMLWLFPLFKATPILNFEHVRFRKWVKAQVEERKKMTPDRPDVFSWLLEAHESGGKPSVQSELNLLGDAYLIAVAGSDTTAATLTCLFFQLAGDERRLKSLQREIDEAFDNNETVDSVVLARLTYLDAIINETLRLHPPVPSGVQRITPPEGLRIGEVFVPGETIVQIPTHTLFRDPRIFPRPEEFIPERWTTEKELVADASAFVPFSTGRYSCIGKQLGLMEIRYTVAQIVRRYNVDFAPSQKPQAFLDGKRDTFTLALGSLDLVFSPRQGKV